MTVTMGLFYVSSVVSLFSILMFNFMVSSGKVMPKCSVPDYAILNPLVCSIFPAHLRCDNHNKFIACVCPSFLIPNRNIFKSIQKEYEFDPVTSKTLKLVTDFHTWRFPADHQLFSTFPIDHETKNFVRQVNEGTFSIVYPIPFQSGTKLAAISSNALSEILDLSPAVASSPAFLKFISGELEIESAIPLSHRYGGHQFGHWAGQLGDGRAVLLGEYINQKGERWELQLKGSGLTPYSRQGDGRAVIRSSVREFLCSEAMYHLGIPTSRAASIVISNDTVTRDQFYDGHPQQERTAVVLRLARSWFRIGSLEILTFSGEIKLLKKMTDFIIAKYFPQVDISDPGKYLAFFQEVVRETAFMVALWQSVGFTHGVCNTDNFSLLSITIDYGPFGFLDAYDPKFVPNTSDDEHRYSYENQPDVAAFNLEKLRLALSPLWDEQEKMMSKKIVLGYIDYYKSKFMEIFLRKLGFVMNRGNEDENLVAMLLKMMSDTKADFTMTFRELSEISLQELMGGSIADQFWALNTVAMHKWFEGWVHLYLERLDLEGQSDKKRQDIMQKTNPRYILRNWIAQLAVGKTEQNDFSLLNQLYNIFQNPFLKQNEAEYLGLADPPPKWASSLKVSCSS